MATVGLWAWSECPSHERAYVDLVAALRDLGRADLPVEVRWVETEDEAQRLRFIGSPTIVVDGRDVLPPPDGEQFGLNCRVYVGRDGRFSPLPDPDDLREALAAALDASCGATGGPP